MSNTFDGPSWIAGGQRLDEIREAWESATFAAAQASPVINVSLSAVDYVVGGETGRLKLPWYQLIGNMGVALGSDSSRMKATGQNYSATEEQAVEANDRFWGDR